MPKRGFFLTLEGTDGVGKTTHAKLLKSAIEKKKRKVILTREPGGGPFAEKIRQILLDPKTKIENQTELLLYQAARVEHVYHVIEPALKKGWVVICDRFTDATIAYQGFARGLSLDQIKTLNKIATNDRKPDLTVFLDLPPKVGLKRAQKRAKSKKGDRLENEGVQFQKKVRKGYLSICRKEPKRVKRVLVQNEVKETQAAIQKIVLKKIR